MFCRNCGKEVDAKAIACPSCGVPPMKERKFCQNCGSPTQPAQIMCVKCGVALGAGARAAGDKNKVTAGILGILLGALGIHKFYLGYNKAGVVMLIVSIVGSFLTFGLAAVVMGLVGLIEGIIYLTKSDEEFAGTYVAAERQWF